MIDYLNSLSAEDWRKPLRDEESYLFKVTNYLLKGGKLSAPPDNAVTVYKDILIEVAKGEFTMNADAGWDIIYRKINKNKLKATAKNIRDLFISDMAITPGLFMTFSDMLFKHADLKEKSSDVARKILAPIATDEKCLEFIIENDEYFSSLIDKAGDDAEDFIDIVRQKISEPECGRKLLEFSKAIGIKNVEIPETAVPEESKEGSDNN